jgi:biopolymer transport protein ExbB
VLEILKSGGWLMLPILFCSVLAMAIIIERFWTLQMVRVMPEDALRALSDAFGGKVPGSERLQQLGRGSPLGQVLVAGLINADHGREAMVQAVEQRAAVIVHEMERYLNTLGTIAAITPLLGLLGTVIGMIRVFSEIMLQGTGNPNALAGGISEALITTAAGLTVAIPTYAFHRHFLRRVDSLVLSLEQEAGRLVDAMQQRERQG